MTRRADKKASPKPTQQQFIFEGLPTRPKKAKRPKKSAAAAAAGIDPNEASTGGRPPGAKSAASRVNYVQQELDLSA
jgi:hypothetical protein